MAFVKHVGSAQNKTSSETITITVAAGGCAAGNLVVVRTIRDYAASSSSPSVSDPRGNTWFAAFPTSSGTVLQGNICYSKLTTALQAGDLLTVTLTNAGNPVNAKAVVADEFSGVEAVVKDDDVFGGSATTDPFNATVTITVPCLLVGMFGLEGPSGDTFNADPDFTTLTRVGTSGGSASSNVTNNGAYKEVAAGTHLWDDVTFGTARAYAYTLVAFESTPRKSPPPRLNIHRSFQALLAR